MAKKPDLSDITKKIDISGIMNSLKTMINPAGGTPDVDPSDAIGVKIAQISTLVQDMAKAQSEQAKELAKVNQLLNGLYQDLEALRHPPQADEKPAPKAESQSSQSTSSTEETKTQSKDTEEK